MYNSRNQTTGQSYAAALIIPSNRHQIKNTTTFMTSRDPVSVADAGLSSTSDDSNKHQSVRRKTNISDRAENKLSQSESLSTDSSMEVSRTECSKNRKPSIEVFHSTEKEQSNDMNRDIPMIPVHNKYSKLSVESLEEEKEITYKRKRLENSAEIELSKKGKPLTTSNAETSKQTYLDSSKPSNSAKLKLDRKEKSIQESSSGRLLQTS